jgi:hypothetical protein
VHEFLTQVNLGRRVRCPNEFLCVLDGSEEGDTHLGDETLRQVDLNVVLTAVNPISVLNGVGRLDASVGEVRWNIGFHSVLLGLS